MVRLNDIVGLVLSYYPKADVSLIEMAYIYAAKVHGGAIRTPGKQLYMSYLMEAAYTLAQMKMDAVCVVAGLLNYVLEDNAGIDEDIERWFGTEVLGIVKGVTEMRRFESRSVKGLTPDEFQRKLLAMSDDIRVILVKLADRLHTMRVLGFHKGKKRNRIARETLEIYVPLAQRLGINWVTLHLSGLCLYYLNNDLFEQIKAGIDNSKNQMANFITSLKEFVRTEMLAIGIDCSVETQPRGVYSVFADMKERGLDLSQALGMLSFKILPGTSKDCYAALENIHGLFKPVPGGFHDCMSVPKHNICQSLDTTVVGPEGKLIEFQIRTPDMDKIAEEGILAFWRFNDDEKSGGFDAEKIGWIRQS